MADTPKVVQQVQQRANVEARQVAANPWVKRLARLGYGAKGVVYATVGVLAAQAALGRGGATTDTRGALQAIASQPFGTVLLAIIGVGLLGYALWRLLEAWMDPERKGTDAEGILQRVATALRGLLYGGLGVIALQSLTGATSSDGNMQETWAARILSIPFGPWLLGAAGLGMIGVALHEAYRAYTADFREKLNLGQMSGTEQEWTTRLGRLGLAARAVVFALTGLFLIQAARQSDASEAGGLAQALETLARQPYGPWLLAVTAAGLIAYGLFMLVHARYLRVGA